MRIDFEKWAFTAIGQGGTIADVDARDVFQIAFAVDVTSVAGAPTNFRVVALPLADVALGTATGNEHIRKTADLTAAGKAILGTRVAATAEPAIENVYSTIRITADFTAGTGPTITGNLYVMKKRF